MPIHVIEELLDALEEIDQDSNTKKEEVDDVVMAIGHSDVSVLPKRRTMKLSGKVGKLDILILVDSGSVGTFISDILAQQLQLPITSYESAQFLAADGGPMVCNQEIQNLQWTTQGYSFTSSVGILPLRCLDMILGQDWLEECSPMWVHW